MLEIELISLFTLKGFLSSLPDGTTADILAPDLEAGNFDTCRLIKPDGTGYELTYTGEVAEGYVSPFEMMNAQE
jgi:hypothetical protein